MAAAMVVLNCIELGGVDETAACIHTQNQARSSILTFHRHTLSNIAARRGGTNALLSEVANGGPVDGVGGGSADGGNGDDCGDLHFRKLRQGICNDANITVSELAKQAERGAK